MEYLSQVLENTKQAEGIFKLILKFPKPEIFKPGHFVMLAPTNGSIMPRPFSVTNTREKPYQESLALLLKAIGKNTKYYSELKIGDLVKISGPKGSPIKIEESPYILVAGGIGIAGLLFLVKQFYRERKQYKLLYGAKSRLEAIELEEYINVEEVIEEECQKFVTEALERTLMFSSNHPIVLACGPQLMLKEVARISQKCNHKCFVLMEEMMACGGSGSCKSCAVFMKNGSVVHVCQDGPLFDASKIDWEKIGKRFTPVTIISKSNSKSGVKNPLAVKLRRKKMRRILELNSPIMNASGCFDASIDVELVTSSMGAIITKGIGEDSRPGNDCPRVCEVNGGMINSIGLEEKGIDEFLEKYLKIWLERHAQVIVNVAGKTKQEFVRLAKTLSQTDIAGIELNYSCPNIQKGGMQFGISPSEAYETTLDVRRHAMNKFIIVKLTPQAGANIEDVARAVLIGGADAISVINTIPALDIDIYTYRSKLGSPTGSGGFSGPGVLYQSLYIIRQLALANLDLPIIGVGGINNGQDALKMFIAGASAIEIGTGTFINKNLATEIRDYLLKEIEKKNLNSINDFVNTLKV
jgi:dihydroorotate dehydrogenase (NAD+) catalytic subunit